MCYYDCHGTPRDFAATCKIPFDRVAILVLHHLCMQTKEDVLFIRRVLDSAGGKSVSGKAGHIHVRQCVCHVSI